MAPEDVSTLDYFAGIFQGPFYESSKPFNYSNLPCPPQSLIDAQHSADELGFMLPDRPGYAPIIAPPLAIQNIEPEWHDCTTQFAFDPPRTLVPASALVPSPTPATQEKSNEPATAHLATLDPPPIQTLLAGSPPIKSSPNSDTEPSGPADPPNVPPDVPATASQNPPDSNQSPPKDSLDQYNDPSNRPAEFHEGSDPPGQPIDDPPLHGQDSEVGDGVQATPATIPGILWAGSAYYSDSSGQFNLPGIGIIKPDGVPVTTGNAIYSLAPSATAIISNGVLIPILLITAAFNPSAQATPVLTFGGSAYVADSASKFSISGQVLTPGSTITIAGTKIFLALDASPAVIDGSTQSLVNPTATDALFLTLAETSYTANSRGDFIIAGQTLTKGGVVTLDSTRLSLDQSGRNVVLGTGCTQAIATAEILPTTSRPTVTTIEGSLYPISYTTAPDDGIDVVVDTKQSDSSIRIGGYIVSAFNGGGLAHSNATLAQFAGHASGQFKLDWISIFGTMVLHFLAFNLLMR